MNRFRIRRNVITNIISRNGSAVSLALGVLLFLFSISAQAQQSTKIPRIGYLSGSTDPTNPGSSFEAFRQAFRELGYTEGKNIVFENRYAEGKRDRIPSLVAELVKLKVDVFLTGNLTAIRLAKQATQTIPIVMVTNADPVAAGLVNSLARPGGNITGIISNPSELPGKRLELLKETVPKASRLAILFNPETRTDPANEENQTAAQPLGLKLQILPVRTTDDLDDAFRVATREHTDALIVTSGAFTNFHQKRIADLAIKSRLPAMYNNVDSGFLMSYDANRLELFRRAATYVDKILKGAKPADLPVEQPTKFELVINLKTAKQIGLRIPPNVLARADRVIR